MIYKVTYIYGTNMAQEYSSLLTYLSLTFKATLLTEFRDIILNKFTVSNSELIVFKLILLSL